MVTIAFYSGVQLVGSEDFNGVNVDANVATIHSWREVDMVEISIDGPDLLFIDYVRLEKDGSQIQGWGTDEGSGWCISTDTTESIAIQTGDCAPSKNFVV